MPDTSKYWREVDNMSDSIEYLYGNYSGKSTLDKKIQTAEEILIKNKELQEESLERIFDQENLVRLKAMNIKDFSWQDVEILNEIKKRHVNVGKTYDGSSLSDVPQAEGAIPDTASLKSKIINTANELVSLIQNRGVSVQPIPLGASLQDILAFTLSFRDALKNSQTPETDNEDIKYSKEELLATKSEIEKMLRKLDGR